MVLWESELFVSIRDLTLERTPNYVVESSLILLYQTQVLFHLQGLFLEPKHELNNAIVLHHTAMLVLLFSSYYCNFVIQGLCVFLLHNRSDIGMFLVRFVQSFDEGRDSRVASLCMMVLVQLLVVVWFNDRVLRFGLLNLTLVTEFLDFNQWIEIIISVMLIVLWVLNLHWLTLFLRKTYMFFVFFYSTVFKHSEDTICTN